MLEKFKKALPFLLKKVLIPFLIIAPISVVIALLIAEKMVQYANPQLTYKIARIESLRVYAKSDFLPFQLKPNLDTIHIGNTHEFSYSVKTNSMGYRMDEFPKEKPEDEFRILMLGDSMTFGYGVEVGENLPSQLEKKLNEYLAQNKIKNKKIRIVNAGFADGKSPDTYYLYLKKIGLDLKPDLVIVNYFINNDIADLEDTDWVKQDSNGMPEKITSKTTYIDDDDYTRLKNEYQNWKYLVPVLKNSHLWILFSTALESKSPETVIELKKALGVHKLPFIVEDEFLACLFDSECNEKMNSLFDKFLSLLKATSNLAGENNIPILFGILPANPQIKNVNELINYSELSEISEEEKIVQISEALKDVNPQKKIIENSQLDNETFIDPLPYMIDSNWQDFYFPKDGHATTKGNERFALAYFDFLVKSWNLPSKLQN